VEAQKELISKLDLFIRAKIRIARHNNHPKPDFTRHLQAEIKQIIPNQTSLFTEKCLPFPKLHWKNSDTALLELIIALQRSGAIVAEDGKLSQRQLLQVAERLFNRPIKSPSTKLNQARERKKDNAVFLENLKGHFQAYSQELDEKQRKRR
jgi:hypothetical protein